MKFKKIIENGWPTKAGQSIEIRDPSSEKEVLSLLEGGTNGTNLRMEMIPGANALDLVVRESSGAVIHHLASC